MIDLHTHTLFSDGVLLPCELVRRAEDKGYTAIAITDHCDVSNIDFVIPRIVKTSSVINKYWKIKCLPGVELTHLPLEVIPSLVSKARKLGAKVVVGHGETVCEPVIKGTNKTFINAGVDILAHPGNITDDDVKLAVKKRVCLELTTRHGHDATNKHVLEAARRFGAKLVIDNDAHQPKDLLTLEERNIYISNLNISADELRAIELNSVKLIKK